MPFCPKCKYEYIEGITKCADCGCDLVEDLSALENQSDDTDAIGNSEDNLDLETNQTQDVDNPDTTNTDKVQSSDELTEDEFLEKLHADTTIYKKKSDQYKDFYSSSITLIIVGIVGDIFIILTWLSLIPLEFNLGIKIMFTLVMGCLFNAFLFGGIHSYKKAKEIHGEVEKEEKLTEDILSYIAENYTLDFFIKEFGEESEPGALYYDRTNFIRNKITEQFGSLEESYLENLIEQLYASIFESDEN